MKLDMRPVPTSGRQNFMGRPIPRWSPSPGQAFFGSKSIGNRNALGIGKFNVEEIPLSLMIAGGSIAALAIGSLFPQPAKTIMIGASLAGIGYSIFNLFTGEPAAPPPPPPKVPSEEDFKLLNGSFLLPLEGSTVSYPWYQAGIGVQYSINNNSDDNATVTYDIYEEIWSSGIPKLVRQGILLTDQITLRPHQPSGVIYKVLSIEKPAKANPWETGFTEKLTLRKYDAKGNPVPMASVRFFVPY
jgi:hypothetical protein